MIARRVFQRAGTTETRNLELDLVPKEIVYTYTRELTAAGEEHWRSDRYQQPVHGTPAGGGWSTAADMARFVDAMRGNKLLSAEMTARMLTPKPELSSPNYGFGAQIFDSTANLVGHTGGGPGTAAHVQFDKMTGLTATVLINSAGPSAAIVRCISRPSRSLTRLSRVTRRLRGVGDFDDQDRVRCSVRRDGVLSRRLVQSALWAHPAVTGSSIIVKDVDKVICSSF